MTEYAYGTISWGNGEMMEGDKVWMRWKWEENTPRLVLNKLFLAKRRKGETVCI